MVTTTNDVQPTERGRGLDLMDLVRTNRVKLAIALAAFGGAGYLIAAVFMWPAYRAEALVMPRQAMSSGALSGLLGQALPDSLGIPHDQNVDKNVPLQTIVSHALLETFIRNYSVIQVLCRSRAISCGDAQGNAALNQERTMNSAISLFQQHVLSVDENQLTGVVHISVIWYDRKLAADWCNELIDLTNHDIQNKAETTASLRVKYLKQEYANTQLVPLQTAIGTILQTELTKQVDAATRSDYAWQVLDRAYPPDDRRPARPLKSVIAAVAGIAGALSLLAILAWRSRSRLT